MIRPRVGQMVGGQQRAPVRGHRRHHRLALGRTRVTSSPVTKSNTETSLSNRLQTYSHWPSGLTTGLIAVWPAGQDLKRLAGAGVQHHHAALRSGTGDDQPRRIGGQRQPVGSEGRSTRGAPRHRRSAPRPPAEHPRKRHTTRCQDQHPGRSQRRNKCLQHSRLSRFESRYPDQAAEPPVDHRSHACRGNLLLTDHSMYRHPDTSVKFAAKREGSLAEASSGARSIANFVGTCWPVKEASAVMFVRTSCGDVQCQAIDDALPASLCQPHFFDQGEWPAHPRITAPAGS
jgi:hypothetical protein